MKDGQTFGQWLNWDFKANGGLEILDKNENLIYFEYSDGFWVKRQYDSQDKEIYVEYSDGFWVKREWDSQGKVIYYENSDRKIVDNRIPEVKVIEHNGRKYQLIP
jgi:hypothetical protein